MAEQPPKRRKPLGPPLTAAELEALADIGPDDLAAAAALWEAEAPKPLRDLLKAEPAEEA